jgi:betaine-aldehyde dehydrogenase
MRIRGAARRWPNRTALLGKIAELLQRDREQVAQTESLDTGKTLNEARADVDGQPELS